MTSTYADLARELRATGLITDPWIRGEERFQAEPIVLERAEWEEAVRCAEAVAEAHDEVVRLCLREPELLESFLGLTPVQRAMFAAQAPAWHGIARADLFRTARGFVCCELNSDTPSGQAEAVVLGARASSGLHDPTAKLRDRFLRLVGERHRVGIVYPTEMTEDLSMIALYRRWLGEAGIEVVLGSPFNLSLDADLGVHLLGERCDAIVRHYKTDWWSEREPVWRDAVPFPDKEPLVESLGVLFHGIAAGTCALVNPFGAVVSQNKRAMALMWERLDSFSPRARDAIQKYIPRTIRLEAATDPEKDRWVLKSDYGCEGAEVVVGALATDSEWKECLAQAILRRWVLQERFDGGKENIGLYVVAGRVAGAYARVQDGPTDDRARSAGVLVKR